jgi:hypothetical protein
VYGKNKETTLSFTSHIYLIRDGKLHSRCYGLTGANSEFPCRMCHSSKENLIALDQQDSFQNDVRTISHHKLRQQFLEWNPYGQRNKGRIGDTLTKQHAYITAQGCAHPSISATDPQRAPPDELHLDLNKHLDHKKAAIVSLKTFD